MNSHISSFTFIVLGMHRSGTSALSRLLELVGLRQSPHLMGANESNPSGYWEPIEVVRLNDRLLKQFGRHWADPKPLPEAWAEGEKHSANVSTAIATLERAYGQLNGIVLKDPRLSRVFPVWREAILANNVEPVCLIACRNPLEVRQSLHLRDEMTFDHALHLWLSYMLEAEAGTRGLRRVVVHYEDILNDWNGTLESAFSCLGLTELQGIQYERRNVDQFIDNDQRHNRAATAELQKSPDVREEIKSLFNLFQNDQQLLGLREFDVIRSDWQAYWARRSPDTQESEFAHWLPIWHPDNNKAVEDRRQDQDITIAAQRAVALDPDNAQNHYDLGNLLTKAGRFEEAEPAFCKAITLDGSGPNYHQAHSNVLNQLNRTKEAIEAAQKAVQLDPENDWRRSYLGNLLIKAGRLEEAEVEIRKATTLDGSRSDYIKAHSNVLDKLGQTKEAIKVAHKAAELDRDNAQYHYDLGNLLTKAGRIEEAEPAFCKAITLDGSGPNYHQAHSNVLNQLNRTKEAIEAAQKAVQLDPENDWRRSYLGNLLIKAGRLEEAEVEIRKAITLDGSRSGYIKAHSDVLSGLGQTKEAIRVAKKAIELNPDIAQSHHDLGKLLGDAGMLSEAEAAYDAAVTLDKKELGLRGRVSNQVSAIGGIAQTVFAEPSDDASRYGLQRLLAELGSKQLIENAERLLFDQALKGDCEAVWPLGRIAPIYERVSVPTRDAAKSNIILSVMIPVYQIQNRRMLEESVGSVLAQNFDPDRMQIVVVDDASSNSAAKQICEEFGPRVSYVRNNHNLGLVGNHNNCLATASGEFIHLLHQDDYIEPGFYEALIEPMQRDKSLVAAFASSRFISEGGQCLGQQRFERAQAGILPDWATRLAQFQRIMFPSIVVRRSAYEAVGGFTPSLVYAFDWEMWAQLATSGPVWHEPRPLANYRIHAASATNGINPIDRLVDELRTAILIASSLPERARLPSARIAIRRLLLRWWQKIGEDPKQAAEQEHQRLIDFLVRDWANDDEKAQIKALYGASEN